MYQHVKRILDIVFSLLGVFLLSPVFVFVAIAIKIESKGPVFFFQERLGYKGRKFNIIKFRSMEVNSESAGVYSDKNDTRVTKVGKIIRAMSIDELPQFFNIIKGEMSIIGPRPPLTYHPKKITEYSSREKARFNVKPGVTGWAQVNGRKQITWSQRFELDAEYVENMNWFFDTKIFFLTIYKVLIMSGNQNVGNTAK